MDNREKNREEQNKSAGSSSETPIYLTTDSTLQTPDEERRDKSGEAASDSKLEVSNDDLHETDADRFAGSDRAGTAERKDNDMNPENDEG